MSASLGLESARSASAALAMSRPAGSTSGPREPNAEPIPGYRLIEPIGSGGFGEVWKCEAPGGLFKAIKFVYGNLHSLDIDGARAEQEMEALSHQMSELDPSSEEYRQVTDRFHRADSEFRARDGYTIEAEVGTVLNGLGFSKEDWARRTEEF